MPAPRRRSGTEVPAVDFFRTQLSERAGIALSTNKADLITTRLRERLLLLGLTSLEEYADHLRGLPGSHDEWQEFVNRLTTNKTDFFREPEHFTYLLKTYLPAWRLRHQRVLRLWSAACSTGEEPYTLAMVLRQAAATTALDYRICASDIDTSVLRRAQAGVYPEARLTEVPVGFHGCFDRGTAEIAGWVRIKRSLKAALEFRTCNLVEPPFPWTEPFDIIFCRNVMIYFASATIARVAESLYAAAAPGALLFIGHSESLQNIRTSWEYVQPSLYRKRP